MDPTELLQGILIFAVVAFLAWPVAGYMKKIYCGELQSFPLMIHRTESYLYRMVGINPSKEMNARQYLKSLLTMNFCGFALLLSILLLQDLLPLNPMKFPSVSFSLAFNTATSFVTNTNWQAYSGESTLSYFSQMAGLGVQNFLSAASAMAVAVALSRSISRRCTDLIGNFWVDFVRSVIYILLPFSIIVAIVLLGQGVVQSFLPYTSSVTLEEASQVIPSGPAASQIAIKQIGSNGGGFFGANSSHPFENPTPFSNFVQIVSMLLIPFAFPIFFGKMVGHLRHGRLLLLAMCVFFVVFLAIGLVAEVAGNPMYQWTGAMEGKEVRFGLFNSVFWSVATAGSGSGSVNAMLSSVSPGLAGVVLLNIMLGGVLFGGVGCGLYGIAMYSIITVFIAGLMVGRSPEYLGKKLDKKDIKLALIATVTPGLLILCLTAVALLIPAGLSGMSAKGPHGLSEVLFAFTSSAGTNGSAFGGLNANTTFYNFSTAVSMAIARYVSIFCVLGIAQNMSSKNTTPVSSGTFPLDGGIFFTLLIGIILILGALTFFPVLSLGPIAEHMLLLTGRRF